MAKLEIEMLAEAYAELLIYRRWVAVAVADRHQTCLTTRSLIDETRELLIRFDDKFPPSADERCERLLWGE